MALFRCISRATIIYNGHIGMTDFRDTLLEIWREVALHREIVSAADAITTMLAGHLPLDWLLVRKLDAAHQTLDSVASRQAIPSLVHPTGKTACTPAKWKRLYAWAEQGKVLHLPSSRRAGDLAQILPPELDGDVLAGPLLYNHVPIGVLVFTAQHLKTFKPEHEELFQILLEPLAAALENDRRLHELATLREAAEADRRSLLTRLGGKEMNEAIVGSDTGLAQVMQRVELVSSSDVPVLILGETGTGKEVVSRAIHSRSVRAQGPFIRVNCGAIPPELIDSQLFGHERGSFTGANDTRKGWFERADGGTLFLDEIGELPLQAQVRLLRVLQDSYIERVGGQQPIHVDVRIVAATHRDLSAMVKARTFREDLWYRVNVFPILLPRLRERAQDIPALAKHFAQRAANRFGLQVVEPTMEDLQVLMSYSWPGNIRELGAVIDRAAILGEGKSLAVAKALGINRQTPSTPAIVDDQPTFYEVIPEVTQPLVNVSAPPDPREIDTLDSAMKQHIQKALVATRGQIEGSHGAAKLLKINPHTLRARMRKMRIEWSEFRQA